MLAPAQQGGPAGIRERINAAFDPDKPAINVSEQDLGGVGQGRFQIPWPCGALGQGSRAGECLLPIRCHEGLAHAAARDRIAVTPPVFLHDAGSTLAIAPRPPGNRLDENVDLASGGDAEDPEAQEAAELLDARILFSAPAAAGCAHGDPDLIADSRAVHSLEDQFQREGELQLSDDDGRRFTVAKGHEIAPANLALHLEAELFEEAFDGRVEA